MEGEDTATAEPVLEDDTAKATVEGDGHPAKATGAEGQEEQAQVVEEKVDWAQRYKELQKTFTQNSMELAEAKKTRETDKSAELQAKIDSLQAQLSDPSALVARMEQTRRAKEEEETLDPAERSIRELKQTVSQMQSDRMIERAESVFEDLKDSDPFFSDMAKEIVQLVASDQDLKMLIVRDPVKGFKAVKGQLIDEYQKDQKEKMRKEIELEEKKKIEDAKGTKTSLSATGNTGGGPKGTSKEVGMTTEEAFDEYYRLHPEKKPAGW